MTSSIPSIDSILSSTWLASGGLAAALFFLVAWPIDLWRRYRLARQTRQAREDAERARIAAQHRADILSRELQLIYRLLGPDTNEERIRNLVVAMTSSRPDTIAAVFRFDGRRFQFVHAQGLSPVAERRVTLEPSMHSELAIVGTLRFTHSLQSQPAPLRGLDMAGRAAFADYTIRRIGTPQKLWGALVTSGVETEVGQGTTDDPFWQRVLGLLGDELAWGEQSVARDSELAVSREILELRGVVDQHFGGPAQMLQEFLRRLVMLADFERVAVYLPESGAPLGSAAVRAGTALPRSLAEDWFAAEDRLAASLARGRGFQCHCAQQLDGTSVPLPFSTIAVVPLERGGEAIGALSVTRRGGLEVHPSDRSLLEWAGNYLIDLLSQTMDRVTIAEQARVDALTLLANRRTFDAEFQNLLRTAAEKEGEFGLLLLDLDRFKAVNDERGHLAGDAALRTVAHVVQRVVAMTRESDRPLAARYGGEELAILLPGTDRAGAQRIGEAIREAVERTPIRHEETEFHVTLSGGMAIFPRDGRTSQTLLSVADAALYAAKKAGRNRIQLPGQPAMAAR